MALVLGTVTAVLAREANVAFDHPVHGAMTIKVRDEIGLSLGERVRIEAHPASPMGVVLLFAMIPIFLALVGIAWARSTGTAHPVWIGLGMGAAGLIPMIAVERFFRRRAGIEAWIVSRSDDGVR